MTFAGTVLRRSFEPLPNQIWNVDLSGEDGFGRPIIGSAPLRIRRGYAYQLVYRPPGEFRTSWSQYPRGSYTANRTREGGEIIRWRETVSSYDQVLRSSAGRFEANGQKLGGFTIDSHHVYDAVNQTVYRGDGQRQSAFF
ncbi:MAG: hypothetical protein AAF658_21590, partial [Myxococcota bacterium]